MISQAYATYLRSEHWRDLKTKLGVRCAGKCEACSHDGSIWTLDGHHLIYRTPLESGVLDDLLGICRRCHDIVHDLGVTILFANGTPVEVRRVRTLSEVKRYLPDLTPSKPTIRELKQAKRRVQIDPRSSFKKGSPQPPKGYRRWVTYDPLGAH